MKKHHPWLAWFLLVVVTPGVSAVQARQLRPEQNYALLSGSWSGTRTTTQKGSCSIENKRRVDTRIEIALEFDSDGSFKGTLLKDGETKGTALHGVIGRGGNVTATESGQATCNSNSGVYSVDLHGKVFERDGRQRLELKGVASPCPPKCVFEQRYRLDM